MNKIRYQFHQIILSETSSMIVVTPRKLFPENYLRVENYLNLLPCWSTGKIYQIYKDNYKD